MVSARTWRRGAAAAALVLPLTLVAASAASAADPTPTPTPTDGYGAPHQPSVGLAVKSPECDGNVPYLRYAVDVSKDPSATAVDLTWTSLDGSHSQTQKNLPVSGKVLWLGAEESGGQPTAWPGWVFKDGTWEEGGPYTWVRPDVKVTFTVHDADYTGVATTARAHVSDGVYRTGTAKTVTAALALPAVNAVSSVVSYPPATTACANPANVPGPSSSPSTSVEPTSGTTTAGVVPGETPASRSDARSGLAETGANVLPFAGAAAALLLIGGGLLLAGRRRRKAAL
ncbi:LPXTG cell wall anchor domain-containing protein [Luteimicrobium sp. DT211]|uniref:LPXTG cell wall anchor domain-containing protein n=1 Tax=Luteimicrobium sp. DT211 TaxID=3393412 RepID=UPI003CF78870